MQNYEKNLIIQNNSFLCIKQKPLAITINMCIARGKIRN